MGGMEKSVTLERGLEYGGYRNLFDNNSRQRPDLDYLVG